MDLEKIRWDLLQRYRLIETVALWEGRLNTNDLIVNFRIGRQQASKDINTYLKEIGPGNLTYDKHLKGYKPTESFTPKIISGHIDEYLHILSRSNDVAFAFNGINLGNSETKLIQPVTRNISPDILRPLIRAMREQKRVDISYISFGDGKEKERIITPHTLVCTPLRWHVRAYCELAKDYRDFVLSRIRGIPVVESQSSMSKEQDKKWNTGVQIIIGPDERLKPEQAEIIEKDYGMKNGVLTIDTNVALIRYVLDSYNLQENVIDPNRKKQQIVIRNLDDLKQHLSF